MYGRALDDFFAWREREEGPPFTRATVQAHRAWLIDEGYAASSVNQRLAAIKKLAKESAAAGWMPFEAAGAISDVPGVRQAGVRMGTKPETQRLLDTPAETTLKGLRDRALLALLIACGLRRSELVALNVEHLEQRDGRWVIIDLVGKHGRVRTVPVPAGARQRVDNWLAAAGIESGRIARSMDRHGQITGGAMHPNGVLKLVAQYSHVKPHDLRRTCAKLCRKAGGELEQVQMLLGHASIQTTERYLGSQQDLDRASNDRLGLKFL
jgi:integrase